MRMSVGIGPFRFYSGGRRRSRKQREADNVAMAALFLLVLLGGFIYLIVKAVIAFWPVLLVGAAVSVAGFGIIKLIDRRAEARIAEEIEQAPADVRGTAIGEAIAREHPAHVTSVEVVERVKTMLSDGLSLRAIAEALNADEVPTSRGGIKWYASTVAAMLRRQEAQ